LYVDSVEPVLYNCTLDRENVLGNTWETVAAYRMYTRIMEEGIHGTFTSGKTITKLLGTSVQYVLILVRVPGQCKKLTS
jgi:hypothetical protein